MTSMLGSLPSEVKKGATDVSYSIDSLCAKEVMLVLIASTYSGLSATMTVSGTFFIPNKP